MGCSGDGEGSAAIVDALRRKAKLSPETAMHGLISIRTISPKMTPSFLTRTGDIDRDGLGDSCDPCPVDAANDEDGDGLLGVRILPELTMHPRLIPIMMAWAMLAMARPKPVERRWRSTLVVDNCPDDFNLSQDDTTG